MFVKITQSDIDKIYNENRRKYEGRKEDYFALLYLMRKFNLNCEDAADYVAFGGNDYGIDAFYLDKETKNLYIYQFKWSSNHHLFKDSFNRLVKAGMERVFGNPYQDPTQNKLLNKLRSCLIEYRDIINKVYIHFVFDGDTEKADQSQALSRLKEDLESKNYLINNFFGREVELIPQYISNKKMLSNPSPKKVSHTYQIECENPLKLQSQENELLITFIPLSKLLEIYNDLGEKFFDKNIRSGLDEGKATNKEIKRSLRKIIAGEEPAEHFTFYHNGISLTAQQLSFDNNLLTMIEPRILNGAQTMKTLKIFIEENKTDSRISERLHTIKVIARIVKSSQDDFITKVTINNNRQNPIMPWNLRAGDLIQLSFEDKFKEELGIYYERRQKAFSNLSYEDLEQIGITDKSKFIEIKKFAQTLLAIQGDVNNMSNISEVFEKDSIYKNTFKDKYLEIDAKIIVLFYRIQYELSSITKEILSRGEKYYFVTRARNLLWALLIQALLNDEKFESYVENYGSSLTTKRDRYKELLKDIASKKIRFIFRDTFEKGKYAEYIDIEKYSFLKNNTTFNDCMDQAKKLFKWEKKSI